MTMPPATPSTPSGTVFRLGTLRLRLADDSDMRELSPGQRAWEIRRVLRQEGDPASEFRVPFAMLNAGYGYSSALIPGVYETANKWDLSALNRARTWGETASSEEIATGFRKGWIVFHSTSGYAYLIRGQYAVKFRPASDEDSIWDAAEFHYFGDDRAAAGRPSMFNGNLYVPLIDTSTEEPARFHELSTVNDPAAGEQTLTETGSPTGGTFTLSYDGSVTAALDFDATASEVEAALRALPGLEKVTVERAGTTTDFVWTVTLTAAPTANASDEPPAIVVDDSGLTGGTAPAIAQSTTVNGLGDIWTLGPNGVEAWTFHEWNKPGVGPVLALAESNTIRLCAADPMQAGDWGAAYEVGSTTYRINEIAVYDRYLMVGKEDSLWSFDEQGVSVNVIASVNGIADRDNFVGMREHNARLYCPHKIGLLSWAPGGYVIVGAEQDGAFEADVATAAGHGHTVAVAPYGRYLYEAIHDEHGHEEHPDHAVIASLQAGRDFGRGPLTPHMHFNNHGVAEDIAVASITQQPRVVAPTSAVSDNTVGAIEWADPDEALDGTGATAEGDALTEYLVLTAGAAERVPSGATIQGIAADVEVSALGEAAYSSISSFETMNTTLTLTTPETTATDALVATVKINSTDGPSALNTPSGWTLQQTRTLFYAGVWVTVAMFTRVGAASAGTVVITGGSVGSWSNGKVIKVENVAAIGNTASAMATVEFGGTLVASGVDTTQDNELVMRVFIANLNASNLWSTPASTTERTDANGIMVCDEVVATPQSAPGRQSIFSGNVWVTVAAFTIAFRGGGENVAVDNDIRLVLNDTISAGSNLASANAWPSSRTSRRYGGTNVLWGETPSAADINAAGLGIAISADIDGTAYVYRVRLTIYYRVPGQNGSAVMLLELRSDVVSGAAGIHAYLLPTEGLPAANDPRVTHRVADASVHLSRVVAPNRNVAKTWRAVEFYVDLEPETNTPGFEMWAATDDGDEYQLLDGNGDPLNVTASGAYEAFLPETAVASGKWIQIIPRVPNLGPGQQKVSVSLRDVTLHGTWEPKSVDEVQAVVMLDNRVASDNGGPGLTPSTALKRLYAMRGPRAAGDAPIFMHDPETGEETRCVVSGVRARRISGPTPRYIVFLTLRKAPYGD